MKIKINWGVNISEGSETLTLEEVGVNSLEEWDQMPEEERKEVLQEALDTYDIAYALVDNYEQKD